MEKEDVQLWLQDVHTATYEESQESDGGLVGPDKSNHSSLSKVPPIPPSQRSPSPISSPFPQRSPGLPFISPSPFSTYPQRSQPNLSSNPPSPFSSGQTGYSYPQHTTGTKVPFQIPKESNAAIRQNNFKLTKSNTVCDDHSPRSKQHTLDISEFNRDDILLRGSGRKLPRQSSLSPLPTSSSVVMALPTIDLAQTECVPPRKPLVRKSSSKFLSELTTKASKRPPLQPSKYWSVDIPGVKPSSYVEFAAISSLSEMTLQDTGPRDGEARASRESADLAGSDVYTGSCVAELSDEELSADVSMPTAESFQSAPGQESFQSAPGQESFQLAPGQVGSESKDFLGDTYLLDESGSGKKSPSSEEESAQMWTPNKKSLHRSSSLRHFRSLSDNHVFRSSQDGSGHTHGQGPTSMTFHNHNLGRAASSRMVRSPTLDESTFTRKSSMRSLSKTRSHSPLLENNRLCSGGWPQSTKTPPIRNLLSAPPTRPKQTACGSAPVTWLPKGDRLRLSPVRIGEEASSEQITVQWKNL